MIGTSIVVLFLTWMLEEPSVKAEKSRTSDYEKDYLDCQRGVTEKSQSFYLDDSVPKSSERCVYVLFYYQNQLPDLKDWQISVVMLIGSALNILAVYLASMIGKKYSALKLFSYGGSSNWSKLPAVLFWNASYLYFDLSNQQRLVCSFQPIFDNDLQKQLPSEVRATMLSVYSMMFSLSMIVIFPVTAG